MGKRGEAEGRGENGAPKGRIRPKVAGVSPFMLRDNTSEARRAESEAGLTEPVLLSEPANPKDTSHNGAIMPDVSGPSEFTKKVGWPVNVPAAASFRDREGR